jgi:hypothetical protein
MAARSMTPLDHHYVGVAVLGQRVDERHTERAGADDEIVSVEFRTPEHRLNVARLMTGRQQGCPEAAQFTSWAFTR